MTLVSPESLPLRLSPRFPAGPGRQYPYPARGKPPVNRFRSGLLSTHWQLPSTFSS
ncbi:hypothetical protein SK128_016816, partial [Halocaridina rubra]